MIADRDYQFKFWVDIRFELYVILLRASRNSCAVNSGDPLLAFHLQRRRRTALEKTLCGSLARPKARSTHLDVLGPTETIAVNYFLLGTSQARTSCLGADMG